jgi:electron transport complex protein RnfC
VHTPANIAVIPHEPPEFDTIKPRGTLRIPLSSEAATPATINIVPSVHLERGQRLPAPPMEASHHPIAPAAGAAKVVTTATLIDGRTVPAIEFVCDEQDAEPRDKPSEKIDAARINSIKHLGKNDLPTWIEKLRDSGIWVHRRNSPNLLAQLLGAMKRPIDTLICNLLDADPTTCLNAALAARYSQELFAGVSLLSAICGTGGTVFCSDQRLPNSWTSALRSLLRGSQLRFAALANDYPQCDPTLLLYTLLNRRLRPGRLPTELATVVIDAATAIAVGRRFLFDEPMTHVPMVVRNHPQKLSHFLFIPVGMSLNDLLPQLSWYAQNDLIRGGDLLRDIKIPRDAVAGGSELIIHTTHPEPGVNPEPCIRCGWCIEACPTRVRPAVVLEAAQKNNPELAERAGIEACIECGICSYVCPSKLPLLEGIRRLRKSDSVEIKR